MLIEKSILKFLVAAVLTSSSTAFPSPYLTTNANLNEKRNGDNYSPWSSTFCHGPSLANPDSIRFPPTVRNNTPPDWVAPPYAWIFGNWNVRYSSRSVYQYLYNFQADTYPEFPTSSAIAKARSNIDLTSYMLPLTGNTTIDNHIYTTFGYDTPQLDIDPSGYVFTFHGNGAFANISNTWELLGWGYDRNGIAWRVEYESIVLYNDAPEPGGPEPCLSLLSRSPTGPDTQTVAAVHAALHRVYDGSELAAYVNNMTLLPTDGRRAEMDPVACDKACVENLNMPPTS